MINHYSMDLTQALRGECDAIDVKSHQMYNPTTETLLRSVNSNIHIQFISIQWLY